MDAIGKVERELEIARRRRQDKELSDDYCYVTGSIQPYLDEEQRLDRKLRKILKAERNRQGEFAL